MFRGWGECLSGGVATFNCIPIVIANLLSGVLIFAGVVALIMFILGGYKYIDSGGDTKKVQAAKNNFTYGLIGLAIILFSFVIINIISQVTHVTCITKIGFGCN